MATGLGLNSISEINSFSLFWGTRHSSRCGRYRIIKVPGFCQPRLLQRINNQAIKCVSAIKAIIGTESRSLGGGRLPVCDHARYFIFVCLSIPICNTGEILLFNLVCSGHHNKKPQMWGLNNRNLFLTVLKV